METRVCSICKVEKQHAAFSKDRRKPFGISSRCKQCICVKSKQYDVSEAGQKRMRIAKWKKQGINITHDKYVEIYAKLEGKCQICKQQFKTLCVDHDHTTGKVRGLLCRPCNLGISAFLENNKVMQNAIKYIEETK